MCVAVAAEPAPRPISDGSERDEPQMCSMSKFPTLELPLTAPFIIHRRTLRHDDYNDDPGAGITMQVRRLSFSRQRIGGFGSFAC